MILDDILARTHADVQQRKARTSIARFESVVRELDAVTSLWAALRRPGRITAIAEFKRRSPSAGWIRQDADIAQILPAYVRAGAAGLSILTDQPFFGGSLDDLTQARAAVSSLSSLPSRPSVTLPAAAVPSSPALLRKDFIVDEYQIAEARACGADAVLLIVAALDAHSLRDLFAACGRWGVEALVETHSADEAERAVAAGAKIIGVNHRDLRTFTMDMDLAIELRPQIPAECVMVAESGIRTAADVDRMAAACIDAVLVGESLMRAADPGVQLQALMAGHANRGDGRHRDDTATVHR